ncbi:heat shock protein mitochondrial precursor [Perkinsela sp. CCAP 1560/4]|nr:heat shock protein mitochondrial precursor [Perkinsela sp. CCAP 1560/4]KNH06559.1 heat shock protein mitochondrial precursor [Perkinsela sp. CCAP 1560/4]|eukprot:KNH06552.1 heat shock protein mitochondrial precursor [Perkinsela sp. CCAP 1560/4]
MQRYSKLGANRVLAKVQLASGALMGASRPYSVTHPAQRMTTHTPAHPDSAVYTSARRHKGDAQSTEKAPADAQAEANTPEAQEPKPETPAASESTTDVADDAAKNDADLDAVVDPVESKETEPEIVETEKVSGPADEMTFKAETRQLLDIVACSLYTDKEVFIRELISNASDALEKRRHMELADPAKYARGADDAEPGVSIVVNQAKSKFVLTDTGIGMSKQELVDCLGTICSSGSKAFLNRLKEKGEGAQTMENIIGQFGVGFYSAFMVAKNIKVYSRSAAAGAAGYLWESDGHGSYKIMECAGVATGTKIVLEMKDTELAFCTPQVVERIIKKYSNFISFKISLNGAAVNTVQALWRKPKDEVTPEEHAAFYKFISGAYDTPMCHLHYSVDAPLMIHSLLYIPQTHSEKFGGGRQESAVNLYCRKVLIQAKAKNVLPEWLRFLKGAIDCEDLPLNISREHTQDSALIRKLSTVMTKRVLKWLDEEARKNPAQYEKFVKEFGNFLKEGVCTDQVHKTDIAKLLRFETTADGAGALNALDAYIDRMPPSQTSIYYISAPSKDIAVASPYFEQYREHGLEVVVLTEQIDEFVVQHLENYRKYKLQNIETFDATLDGAVQARKKADGDKKDPVMEAALSEAQSATLAEFMTKRLLGRVGVVKATNRLTASPIVLMDHESAQIRKLMKMMGTKEGPAPKYNIHFNPKHELIRKLYTLSQSTDAGELELGGLLAEQLFDNAVISAGLLDDPRSIVNRLNTMMTKMVQKIPEPSNV